MQERDEVREETVERKIPQVKAMYPYSGQGMEMAKGEVMTQYSFLSDEFGILRCQCCVCTRTSTLYLYTRLYFNLYYVCSDRIRFM